ncbi:hypothetical protein [Nannocystis radixulma]|uniref:Protein kinase domain-containing protein n=1 Tax=Nannocystis radixulma TaxID=2995305 RepID=A0ABT5B5F8_9BACT|nr:hypothetical protein [Nannocystis radixulma]MDC0669365.1 hypothetical protein [Nannocystis radixulma]
MLRPGELRAATEPWEDAAPRPQMPVEEDAYAKRFAKQRLFPRRVAPVKIGRFAVIERLGCGAMGIVYATSSASVCRCTQGLFGRLPFAGDSTEVLRGAISEPPAGTVAPAERFATMEALLAEFGHVPLAQTRLALALALTGDEVRGYAEQSLAAFAAPAFAGEQAEARARLEALR